MQPNTTTQESEMSFAMWTPFSTPPKKAWVYLVGNRDTHQVGLARYMPIKKKWIFPSAWMSFEIQVWAEMPTI